MSDEHQRLVLDILTQLVVKAEANLAGTIIRSATLGDFPCVH